MTARPAVAVRANVDRFRPLNLLLAWAFAWAAVAVSHIGLLRLPYYWDEAGYYIPAAYDFFRFHTLIPVSTLSNAHPPLPSIFLAGCWRVFGFHPLVTRLAVCAVSALALVAVYRIARSMLQPSGAFAVAALTLLYPVWFAQSTLAHADIFAAAATLWALALLVEEQPRWWAAGLCFCAAALAKETAVLTPLALLIWLLWKAARGERSATWRSQCMSLTIAPAALACWYAYHWHRTGFIFGNPEYLRYNATGTLHFWHILYAAWLRVWHVTGHMNLWVATLLTLALWLMPARFENDRSPRAVLARNILAVTFVANLAAFSILGGAVLTRYLLPLFPLVMLFHVAFWTSRTRRWPLAAFVTAFAFIAGSFFDPPYQFTAEDNLSYASAIRVEQQAIARVLAGQTSPTVLTAWPVSDYLTKPELGYVTAPVRVVVVKNFSLEELLRAREQSFDSALLSYQLNPPPLAGHLFGTRHGSAAGPADDLPPTFAAKLLGGEIVWQTLERRHYAAVARRNVAVDAQAAPAGNLTNAQTFIMAAR